MTAHTTQEDRDRCLAAGMNGYIAKPMRYEELIELIDRAMCREHLPAARLPAGRIGRAGVRTELAGRFVDDASRLHAEMRDAVARRDGAALQRAAHSLCGTAGFFAAGTVYDLARRLESLGKAEDFSAETDRALEELAGELARLARPSAVPQEPG
jgi:HPt (histidine-containing phosphotransfer) domain-containing protein